MRIFSEIKKRAKVLMGLVLGVAIVAQVCGATQVAKAASGPQFNFLEQDQEFLRGLDRTTNQASWSDPVSGTAGDTFAGIVYYHNGYVDTTATNVRVKVNIPATSTNKTAVITASVSADNAATITDTVFNGVVKGRSGLTINLSEDANLSLVPGSVEWFPNHLYESDPKAALPNGQTGDTLASSGVNIGNINGCWQYAGYVTFLVKTEKSAQPAMSIDKQVRNVTLGETSFSDKNYAKPGDTLEYQIIAKNSGLGSASNLYLTDAIATGTSYISGSTIVDSVATVDGIAGDGISLGSMPAGQSKVVKFRVKVGQNVVNGASLTNTASLYINKQVLTDTATTIVKFGVSTPTPGTSLPVTGGDSTILTILGMITAGLYRTYRKSRAILISKTW